MGLTPAVIRVNQPTHKSRSVSRAKASPYAQANSCDANTRSLFASHGREQPPIKKERPGCARARSLWGLASGQTTDFLIVVAYDSAAATLGRATHSAPA